jgi:recombinational DNA repair protein RecR
VFYNELYPLNCCQDKNKICENCFYQLKNPYCPFCRRKLIRENEILSKSAPIYNSFMLNNSNQNNYRIEYLNYNDDVELPRSIKKQQKRIRKLEQREMDKNYNKEYNISLSKSYQSQIIKNNIQEDLIFHFETSFE